MLSGVRKTTSLVLFIGILACPSTVPCQQSGAASGSEEDIFGLSSLPLLRHAQPRSISAENPTGEPGNGAKAEPDATNAASELGPGWKVHPYIDLPKQEPVTLASIKGPGIIKHLGGWRLGARVALRGAAWERSEHRRERRLNRRKRSLCRSPRGRGRSDRRPTGISLGEHPVCDHRRR